MGKRDANNGQIFNIKAVSVDKLDRLLTGFGGGNGRLAGSAMAWLPG